LRPGDAEVLYQIARSYLLDFYRLQDAEQRRISLALAMENLNAVLTYDPDHIPALRAKAIIHARAELLYYDPNLSYELAARVAKLEPHANAFLLNLSEWMSGEVRFTHESGHRVPHERPAANSTAPRPRFGTPVNASPRCPMPAYTTDARSIC
jgi:hypothetical protein